MSTSAPAARGPQVSHGALPAGGLGPGPSTRARFPGGTAVWGLGHRPPPACGPTRKDCTSLSPRACSCTQSWGSSGGREGSGAWRRGRVPLQCPTRSARCTHARACIPGGGSVARPGGARQGEGGRGRVAGGQGHCPSSLGGRGGQGTVPAGSQLWVWGWLPQGVWVEPPALPAPGHGAPPGLAQLPGSCSIPS